jgi:hypothetical protein
MITALLMMKSFSLPMYVCVLVVIVRVRKSRFTKGVVNASMRTLEAIDAIYCDVGCGGEICCDVFRDVSDL